MFSSLEQRLSSYELFCSRFGSLGQQEKLSPEEIQKAVTKLVNIYKDDLDLCLCVELIQVATFSKMFKEEESGGIGREHFLCKLILDKSVKGAFPNVEIALRIYRVLVITNCSGERSFSKLKNIKSRLRTTMTQERLSCVIVMSIEHDILRQIDIDELVRDFGSRNARKVPDI